MNKSLVLLSLSSPFLCPSIPRRARKESRGKCVDEREEEKENWKKMKDKKKKIRTRVT
jgi:hypothetical protein